MCRFRGKCERFKLFVPAKKPSLAPFFPTLLTADTVRWILPTKGSGINTQVTDLQARTLAILLEAEREKEHFLALRAVSEARRNLELLGKLAGELKSDMNVTIHTEEVQAIINHVVLILNQEIYDPNVLERVVKRLQEAK